MLGISKVIEAWQEKVHDLEGDISMLEMDVEHEQEKRDIAADDLETLKQARVCRHCTAVVEVPDTCGKCVGAQEKSPSNVYGGNPAHR